MLIPSLATDSWIALAFLLGIYMILVIVSWYKHFRIYDYGFWFLGTGLIFLILYQLKPDELMATITVINILASTIVIVLERKNICQFFFAKDKERNCEFFITCPCGCGYGTCQLDGVKIIDGRKSDVCGKYSKIKTGEEENQ